MADDWLENCNEASDIVRATVIQLRYFARAFDIVGNDIMANDLYEMSTKLDKVPDLVNEISSQVLDDMLAHNRDMMGTILKATLAGVEVARELDEHRDDSE